MCKLTTRMVLPAVYVLEDGEPAGIDDLSGWRSWNWVRMVDLVIIANQMPEGAWTGESLGRSFSFANLVCDFSYLVEGSENLEPTLGRSDQPDKIPFGDEKLLVPGGWAKRVAQLVRCGVVEVKVRDDEPYCVFKHNKTTIDVVDMFKKGEISEVARRMFEKLATLKT